MLAGIRTALVLLVGTATLATFVDGGVWLSTGWGVWLNMLPARRVCEMNNETFQELNLKVDVEGQDPADVAYDWMVEEGFISEK